MNRPPLRLQRVANVYVVRDDEYPGGTKARILPALLTPGVEYVYASAAYGYAQVALAYSCAAVGARATIFTAYRKRPHDRTREAAHAGATIVQIPHGYLSNVTAKARAYATANGATLLPLGFDTAAFGAELSALAQSLPLYPSEVWCVAGSGTLTRALQRAWPTATHHAIRIGATPNAGAAMCVTAPEPFERGAQLPPPFPSCTNYDAKAWRFVSRHAAPDSLFWNVAA